MKRFGRSCLLCRYRHSLTPGLFCICVEITNLTWLIAYGPCKAGAKQEEWHKTWGANKGHGAWSPELDVKAILCFLLANSMCGWWWWW